MSVVDLKSYLSNILGRTADKILVALRRSGAQDTEFEEPKLVVVAGTIKNDGTGGANDSSGQIPVKEASAASIDGRLILQTSGIEAALLTFGANTGVNVQIQQAKHRIALIPITIAAGGAITNVAVVPALASYKGKFIIRNIWMDTTDATTSFFFHNEAGTALTGSPATPGFSPVNLTAYVNNTQLNGCAFSNATANNECRLDVAGVGAGAANGMLQVDFWYEA